MGHWMIRTRDRFWNEEDCAWCKGTGTIYPSKKKADTAFEEVVRAWPSAKLVSVTLALAPLRRESKP